MSAYIPPRRMILSGGGIRVLSYAGALQAFEEKHLLKSIQEFCGVSAGALTALMLSLGYSISTLKRFCLEFDFASLRSVDFESAFEILDQFGIDDGLKLKEVVEKILKHKGFGPATTFQDLANSGSCKGLRVWASDLEMAEPVEFSAKISPNISVITALHASMAFPIYFIPVKHPENGRLLCDGGLFDNYPISFLKEDEVQESIGFTFELSKRPLKIPDFSAFISHIVAGYYMPSYQQLIQRYNDRTIVIPCGEFPALNFEASLEEKHRLVDLGYKATMEFFDKKVLVQGRRRSVG